MRLKFECSNSSSFDSQKEAVSKKDAEKTAKKRKTKRDRQKEAGSQKWQTKCCRQKVAVKKRHTTGSSILIDN